MFLEQYPDAQKRENNAASVIAIQAIMTMVRDVQLLVRMNIIPDASAALSAFEDFQNTLSEKGSVKVEHDKNQ
jgi:hypothetical protein